MADTSVTQGRKNHKHISEEDQIVIERMLRAGCEMTQIVAAIGCTARTLRREIARGSCEQMDTQLVVRRVYLADFARQTRASRAKNKGRHAKLSAAPALRAYVEKKIKRGRHSPYAALMAAKSAGLTVEISTKTLYNSIDRGELAVTRRDLLRKKKPKCEPYKPRKGLHTKGLSIDERPESANARSEIGHMEGDLVVSCKSGSGALLTLTDRMTRQETIIKIPTKEQISVADGLERHVGAAGAAFKSVTLDNGPEFLDFNTLQRILGCPVYYAHPYSAWERGTDENHNGIIRRFFPKGTDFAKVSQRRIKHVQNWMNNYPRRIFGGRSPNQFAADLRAANS
jgi:IS30 family transposase